MDQTHSPSPQPNTPSPHPNKPSPHPNKSSSDLNLPSPRPKQSSPHPNHSSLDLTHSSNHQPSLPPHHQPSPLRPSSSSSSQSLSVAVPPANASPRSSISPQLFMGFAIAMHRQMIRQDTYFLSSQQSRPSLFGLPLILPCREETSLADLYSSVWAQMRRLVSPVPPVETTHTSNHALDCDDSLRYEYPFVLKAVQYDGVTCSWCPWYRLCRGCKIECTADTLFSFTTQYIAVDWEPTALHLRYQASQERVFVEHASISESRRLQAEPVDVDACLQAFTKEEELDEGELYYCGKCKEHCRASKRLDIWRLPPILIIHLKRFQLVNNRWVKSHKIVHFPRTNFNPSAYLAARARRLTVTSSPTHDQPPSSSSASCASSPSSSSHYHNGADVGDDDVLCVHERRDESSASSVSSGYGSNCNVRPPAGEVNGMPTSVSQGERPLCDQCDGGEGRGRARTRSSSSGAKQDLHKHWLKQGTPSIPIYDLYSVVSHSGILGGGHYISYCQNPNGKWYLYNDSTCKEIRTDQVDTDSGYILFYERQGLDHMKYMPDIRDKQPDSAQPNDDIDSDFKKLCCLQ